MVGERQVQQDALFYEFSLERHAPEKHLLRAIDRFAINGEVEQREIARAVLQLEPHPDRPHVFGLQWALLNNEAPLFQG